MKKLLICLFIFQFIFAAQESPNFSQIIMTAELDKIENYIIDKKNQNKFDDIKDGFKCLVSSLIPHQSEKNPYWALCKIDKILNKSKNKPQLWYKIAKLFINYGIDINYKDSNGNTALMLAAKKMH